MITYCPPKAVRCSKNGRITWAQRGLGLYLNRSCIIKSAVPVHRGSAVGITSGCSTQVEKSMPVVNDLCKHYQVEMEPEMLLNEAERFGLPRAAPRVGTRSSKYQ